MSSFCLSAKRLILPNLDEKPEWTLTEKGEVQEENGVKFSFDIYEQK